MDLDDLDPLMPHRPPMRLIDSVEAVDVESQRLVALMTVRSDCLFFENGGVPGWVAIEYMAQAAAALTGTYDRMVYPSRPARPGFLLGTRKLKVDVESFKEGCTYRVIAQQVFDDETAASFACSITDDAGTTVAEACLNAFRPADAKAFIDGMEAE